MRITLSTGTPAEVARPSNAEPTRGLVLLPDIGGLRPLFDDHARRLADELGWVVVAPEPWPGREQLELAERLESVKTLRDDDKRADLLAIPCSEVASNPWEALLGEPPPASSRRVWRS